LLSFIHTKRTRKTMQMWVSKRGGKRSTWLVGLEKNKKEYIMVASSFYA
jgi:hypothetical protein